MCVSGVRRVVHVADRDRDQCRNHVHDQYPDPDHAPAHVHRPDRDPPPDPDHVHVHVLDLGPDHRREVAHDLFHGRGQDRVRGLDRVPDPGQGLGPVPGRRPDHDRVLNRVPDRVRDRRPALGHLVVHGQVHHRSISVYFGFKDFFFLFCRWNYCFVMFFSFSL